MPILLHLFDTMLEVFSYSSNRGKGNKRAWIGKECNYFYLHMIWPYTQETLQILPEIKWENRMEIVRKGRKGRNRANYGQSKRCACMKMTPCKPTISSHDYAPIKHRTGNRLKEKYPIQCLIHELRQGRCCTVICMTSFSLFFLMVKWIKIR